MASRSHSIARRIERVEQHRVEPAGRRPGVAGQVVRGGGEQLALLARVDARRRAAEVAAATQPNLDEDQRVAVARDEVDLAGAAAEIAFDDRDAAGFEEGRRERLGACAGGVARVDRARAVRLGRGPEGGIGCGAAVSAARRVPSARRGTASAPGVRMNWRESASRTTRPVAPSNSTPRSGAASASSCAARNASMPSAYSRSSARSGSRGAESSRTQARRAPPARGSRRTAGRRGRGPSPASGGR